MSVSAFVFWMKWGSTVENVYLLGRAVEQNSEPVEYVTSNNDFLALLITNDLNCRQPDDLQPNINSKK